MAAETQQNVSICIDELNTGKGHLKTAAMKAYASLPKSSVGNEQIVALIPMVHKIAQRLVSYIKPPLSYDDLVSAGTIGLIKAARDYDASHQAEFNTYAYIRIKGAIIDELRGWSFLPSSANKEIQKAAQASLHIAQTTGSLPTDEELAEKLQIPVEKLYETFGSARAQFFVSMDSNSDNSLGLSDIIASKTSEQPEEEMEKAELLEKLAEAIQQLPEKQRQVIILYYQQNLNMKQIAEVFEITEPRVSQLHASAVFNLSVKLRQLKDGRE